jgi:peptide/nickel transport system ATP-binding protein/oligopeptide transport system ATP-binding protein
MTETLLELQNLKTYYKPRGGLPGRRVGVVKAVDGVSLSIRQGETFALVGESGCGKSTLGRSIVRLEEPTDGRILFQGTDIRAQSGRALKDVRRDIQMIFQDPHSSLDPRMKVVDLVGEGLVVQGGVSRREREERGAELLSIVGLRKEHLHRYPHEFSGGQRQRIGIARALMLRPKLVIADEAVSALDVSVRAQVLNLLADLQRDFGLTYLFISHDLSVVEYISDRVGVMYLGRIVELATATALYSDPQMPYTQALLSAIPDSASDGAAGLRQRIVLTGDVPSPIDPPSGCRFRTRCWRAQDRCASEVPQLREVRPGHWAACHFPGKDETELSMRIHDCNWMMIEEYLKHDDRIVVPIGSTEQHGYLSLGTDAILAERVSVEAAEPLGVPVMPGLPFGLAPYFAAFPGSMTLRSGTYVALIRDMLDSLTRSGFRRIAIVNGHGGNIPAVAVVREWIAEKREERIQVLFHSWYNAPRTAEASLRFGPGISHGSWVENFPWTRIPGVKPPAGSKPIIPADVIVQSTPEEIRELTVDGSFGGPHERPDEEMLEIWRTGVEEVRDLIENGWAVK